MKTKLVYRALNDQALPTYWSYPRSALVPVFWPQWPSNMSVLSFHKATVFSAPYPDCLH